MLKIRLWSDLHLERTDHHIDRIWKKSDTDKDQILLLAGDIDTGSRSQEVMKELCDHFRHVIRVPGNHEFYHNDYHKVLKFWQEYEEAGPKNFHFLYNDWRVIDGVRFLGGTMWTPLNNDNAILAYTKLTMSDYSEITAYGELLTPNFTVAEHHTFLRFIKEEFNKPFNGKTVVVTHHSPGNILRRVGRLDGKQYAYYAEIEDIVGNQENLVLWVHGHTHYNADYMINDTRVACNPYGYYGDVLNQRFDSNLEIVV